MWSPKKKKLRRPADDDIPMPKDSPADAQNDDAAEDDDIPMPTDAPADAKWLRYRRRHFLTESQSSVLEK